MEGDPETSETQDVGALAGVAASLGDWEKSLVSLSKPAAAAAAGRNERCGMASGEYETGGARRRSDVLLTR
jgi:Mrp family chromosome partitioning ATPase